MVWIIFGKNGQVASQLQRVWDLGDARFISSREVDFLHQDSFERFLGSLEKPEGIIIAGAYNKVDLAEDCFRDSLLVNAVAPAVISDYCKKNEIAEIHSLQHTQTHRNIKGGTCE